MCSIIRIIGYNFPLFCFLLCVRSFCEQLFVRNYFCLFCQLSTSLLNDGPRRPLWTVETVER